MNNRIQYIKVLWSAAPIIAMALGLLGATASFLMHSQVSDAALAALATLVAAAAGVSSLYIARASKRLSHHPRVFVSYSFENKEAARAVSKALERKGAIVWFDENSLLPGADLHASISAAIESSNTVVALISSRMGEHVARELKEAKYRHVPVFAILEPEADTPAILAGTPNVSVLKEADSEKIASAVLALPH